MDVTLLETLINLVGLAVVILATASAVPEATWNGLGRIGRRARQAASAIDSATWAAYSWLELKVTRRRHVELHEVAGVASAVVMVPTATITTAGDVRPGRAESWQESHDRLVEWVLTLDREQRTKINRAVDALSGEIARLEAAHSSDVARLERVQKHTETIQRQLDTRALPPALIGVVLTGVPGLLAHNWVVAAVALLAGFSALAYAIGNLISFKIDERADSAVEPPNEDGEDELRAA